MSESPFEIVEAGPEYLADSNELANSWPMDRSRPSFGNSALFPVDEEKLMAVPEMLPFGLALFDEEQNFIYGNDQHRKILGRGLDEANSMAEWLALGCPDNRYRNKVLEAWYDDIWTRQLTRTFSLKHRNGGLREVEFRPVLLDDGGLLVTLIDTTEQRRAEDSLRLTDAKFRTVFQHAGIGIALIDKTGRFFDVNPAFQEMVEFPLRELRVMSLKECVSNEDFLRLRNEQIEALRSDSANVKRSELEMDFRRKDDVPLRAKVAVAPIRYGTNDAMFTAFFVRDVTEEAEARQSLQVSQKQNRELLEAIPDLVLLLDRQAVVLDAVSPSSGWSGPSATPDWLGHSISEFLPEFGQEALSLIHTALHLVEVQTIQFELNGTGREYSARVARAGTDQVVVVVEDVTSSKQARELMALQASAFAHLKDAVIVADLRGRIRDWSPAAEQVFGFQKDEILGEGVARLYGPQDEARFNHQLSAALTIDGQWKQHKAPFYRADGSSGQCDVIFVPVKNENHPQSLLGIHRVLG